MHRNSQGTGGRRWPPTLDIHVWVIVIRAAPMAFFGAIARLLESDLRVGPPQESTAPLRA